MKPGHTYSGRSDPAFVGSGEVKEYKKGGSRLPGAGEVPRSSGGPVSPFHDARRQRAD